MIGKITADRNLPLYLRLRTSRYGLTAKKIQAFQLRHRDLSKSRHSKLRLTSSRKKDVGVLAQLGLYREASPRERVHGVEA